MEAKIRSGRGEKQHPESPRRPSMRIVELPAPSMQPPHRFRKAARSAISGSRAAPRRMVLPLAQAAASRSVSVAPTLGKRRVDLGPVQAGRSCQHQPPLPSFQLHRPHFCQPRQMQVDGPGPDAAAAGQAGLGAAHPCQQRRAEQNGGPHLSRCLPRQGAVGRRAGEYRITALPPGGTAHAPQKRHAVLHIRKAGHSLEPHLSRAEQRCRKKRQNAVFCSWNFYASVQRSAPCHHDPFLHVRAPIPQKIPHRMQNRAGV